MSRLFARGTFLTWLFVGLGVEFYRKDFSAAVREVLGTLQQLEWASIGVIAVLFFAGSLFLSLGISLLNRRGGSEESSPQD